MQHAGENAELGRAEAEVKLATRREDERQTGRKKREPEVPDPDQASPDSKAQRNFTDPENRIMPYVANTGYPATGLRR